MSDIQGLASKVLQTFENRHLRLATAESCTGGMISAALTDLAGASNIFERGFVTYSNEAKMEMLGVRAGTLAAHGAVSREVAIEMAAGALENSPADIAISVTGIAGPGGGSAEKPVGLVWFGIAARGREPVAEKREFSDIGREAIRRNSVVTALELVLDAAYADRP